MRLPTHQEEVALLEVVISSGFKSAGLEREDADTHAKLIAERVVNLSFEAASREDSRAILEAKGFVNGFKAVPKEGTEEFNVFVNLSVKSGKKVEGDKPKDNIEFYDCIVFNPQLKNAVLKWIEKDVNPFERQIVKVSIINPVAEPYLYKGEPRVNRGGILDSISL